MPPDKTSMRGVLWALTTLLAAAPAAGQLAAGDYYKKLAADCRAKGSVSCCEASVRDMQARGYRLADADGKGGHRCPRGFSMDMLKCEDTYRWCVPSTAQAAAAGQASSAPRISRKRAIAAARKAIRGKVSLPKGTPIDVQDEGAAVIVTFKTVLKPGTLGADYHARVTLDAKTGKVLKILGSQD